MVSRLRLGIIGAGSYVVSSHLFHMEPWREQVEYTIVNRRNPERLARIKEHFGFGKSTTDWRDVIAERPDIVIVGSPPGLHWEHSKAALEAGAHVLCEKPFTIDPRQAWDLHETCQKTGRNLFVGYGWNYRPLAGQARDLLADEGGIGQIEAVSMRMQTETRELFGGGGYQGAAGDFPPNRETWTKPELSGGGYGQAQLTHLLGLTLWLTGLRAREVFALMYTPPGAPVEFHDAVSIRFTNGAVGTMSGSSVYHRGLVRLLDRRPRLAQLDAEVRVIGSEGMLSLDLLGNALWRYRTGRDLIQVPADPEAAYYSGVGPLDALVQAGLGRNPENRSPAELGARTVELLEAAYRSAASGALAQVSTLDIAQP